MNNTGKLAAPPNAAGGPGSPGRLPTPSLDAFQVSRRLQKISNSIESFLSNQMGRLTQAVEACQQSNNKSKAIQQVLDDLDARQAAWEIKKTSEMKRLNLASEKLVEGWRQLERAQRKWLVEHAWRGPTRPGIIADNRGLERRRRK